MGYLQRALTGWGLRAHPSADIAWSSIFGSGLRTNAGVDVTIDGSLALPAVWACVRVLSETIGMLPLLTYRRQSDTAKERATSHPLYNLLKEQPNSEQTALEFREMMAAKVATWGNGYAYIDFVDANGRVRGLTPLLPDHMTVERGPDKLLRYRYRDPNGPETVYPATRILHLRGLAGDGVVGYSPIRIAMQAVGLGLAAEEFGARFFGNGARPGFLIRHPGKLSDKALKNLRDSWNEDHQGVSQSHRVAILEEGAEVERMTIPPEEAQFIETREYQAHDIARIYRMPPHKIGLLKNATFSNIEHQAIEFVTDTIMPWLVRFEQAYQRDLMSGSEQRTYFIEHLVDGLLRGDIATRYNAYAVARQWGWMSINDIRRLENMDPIEKGGDVYLQPLNMVEAGSPPASTNSTPNDNLSSGQGDTQNSRAIEGWLRDAAGRVVKRELADLRRAQGKLKSDPQEYQAWAQEFYRSFVPTIQEMMEPVVRVVADVSGSRVDTGRLLQDLAAGYVMRHGTAVNGAVSHGESESTLNELLVRWEQDAAGELVAGMVRHGATILPA